MFVSIMKLCITIMVICVYTCGRTNVSRTETRTSRPVVVQNPASSVNKANDARSADDAVTSEHTTGNSDGNDPLKANTKV